MNMRDLTGSQSSAAGEARHADADRLWSIAAVERETGLAKDTLRVWERRYGFPTPSRDAFGERVYPLQQVERLRVLKRLLDVGWRPGRLMKMSAEEVEALAQGGAASPTGTVAPTAVQAEPQEALEPFMDLIRHHDSAGLHRELGRMLSRLGTFRFVTDLLAPLNVAVGDAWVRGRLEVFEEHAYTEEVQVVMRQAISQIPVPQTAARPSVLLSTFPGEPHGLGLLMVEALFRLEGCACVSLGVQTPLLDIVRASQAHQADIVALGFSGILGAQQVLEGLGDLRARLPSAVEVWAGGSASVLARKPVPGVLVVQDLRGIATEVRRWRDAGETDGLA
jgi:DNA-binding transcriptional MerR regulator/methylmalonyl-CoA mutase cobalamin-binding subunit